MVSHFTCCSTVSSRNSQVKEKSSSGTSMPELGFNMLPYWTFMMPLHSESGFCWCRFAKILPRSWECCCLLADRHITWPHHLQWHGEMADIRSLDMFSTWHWIKHNRLFDGLSIPDHPHLKFHYPYHSPRSWSYIFGLHPHMQPTSHPTTNTHLPLHPYYFWPWAWWCILRSYILLTIGYRSLSSPSNP